MSTYADRMIEDLQERIRELERPRTITLRDERGEALLQSTFRGDQGFVWRSDAGIPLTVAVVEVR